MFPKLLAIAIVATGGCVIYVKKGNKVTFEDLKETLGYIRQHEDVKLLEQIGKARLLRAVYSNDSLREVLEIWQRYSSSIR